MCQFYNVFQKYVFIAALIQSSDKAAVYLDDICRKLFQMAQGRVSGPKIIYGDSVPHVMHILKLLIQKMQIGHPATLCQLQDQILCGYFGNMLIFQIFQQRIFFELDIRHIDAHGEIRVIFLPLPALLCALLQDPFSYLDDQMIFLQKRDEFHR